MLSAAANAPAAAASGPAAAKADEKPAEDEKQEEKEDVDMGNLFGGDDEYYWAALIDHLLILVPV